MNQVTTAAAAAAAEMRASGNLEAALMAGHLAVKRVETPRETVKLAVRRMELAAGMADPCGLRSRWPMIADANRDMGAAIAVMSESDRAADMADCQADLDWAAVWT